MPSKAPSTSQSLKFKEKVNKPENCIRPPYSDLPFEFVKTKSFSSQHRDQIELVKYMSKVPSYLQRGEKPQDNVLNFGVLDWRSLEQWTHNREKVVKNDKFTKPVSGSCSSSSGCSSSMVNTSGLVHSREKSSISNNRDASKIKKEKYSGQNSSKCDDSGLEKGSRKLDNSDSEGVKLENHNQCTSSKQQGIVLLFPKDFSSSGSSKEHHRRASLGGKSTEYNWGSFSDIFSIDEIHPEDSFSEIPNSCPLNSLLDTEKELDLKLDTLIKSQGVEIPINPSNMPSHNTETKHFSDEIRGESSLHCRLRSGIARMTRSLSFRESSGQPPLSSTYVTAKSGPAKPEHCSNGSVKVGPLQRLLNPIFKSGERSDDLIVKPLPMALPMNKEHEPLTKKALLHLTVKSGLPLFKFVVGKNDEIFASTLKKDDMAWLYTFYSVEKITKRKVKPSRLGYTVVGQMKVSEPRFPSWCEKKSKGSQMVKESVLYNVELNKEDGATCELKTSRELAAVVVNMPEDNLDDYFSDSEHEKMGQIVVILPGGDHSVPLEGVPSSLITRWRNGGSCDCGGWDIGCKLRILTEKWQPRKYQEVQCDLYDQEAQRSTPFFSLIPLRDGLFSVEYDPQISSLQAFSISVALINSHNDQVASKKIIDNAKASMPIKSDGHEKHASHPPLSPVGRV